MTIYTPQKWHVYTLYFVSFALFICGMFISNEGHREMVETDYTMTTLSSHWKFFTILNSILIPIILLYIAQSIDRECHIIANKYTGDTWLMRLFKTDEQHTDMSLFKLTLILMMISCFISSVDTFDRITQNSTYYHLFDKNYNTCCSDQCGKQSCMSIPFVDNYNMCCIDDCKQQTYTLIPLYKHYSREFGTYYTNKTSNWNAPFAHYSGMTSGCIDSVNRNDNIYVRATKHEFSVVKLFNMFSIVGKIYVIVNIAPLIFQFGCMCMPFIYSLYRECRYGK